MLWPLVRGLLPDMTWRALMADDFTSMVMLDTETTGIDPERCQILTVDATYLKRVDGLNWAPLGEPFHGQLAFMSWSRTEPGALETNKINPAFWKGDSEAEVMASLASWVKARHAGGYCLLTGYGVDFDRAFLEASFKRARIRWTDAFSYRHLDIKQLCIWAKLLGFLETGGQGKRMTLVNVAKELKCHKDGAHNSAVDVVMSVDVMNILLGKFAQRQLF